MMASWDYLIPSEDTSLFSRAEPIELFSKSESIIFFIYILDPLSSTFFFFLPMLDSPDFTLDKEEH